MVCQWDESKSPVSVKHHGRLSLERRHGALLISPRVISAKVSHGLLKKSEQ